MSQSENTERHMTMDDDFYLNTASLLLIECDEIIVREDSSVMRQNDAQLLSLASSIKKNGIIEPLIVRRTINGYELVCGGRRLRAAKLIGMKSVPCVTTIADSLDSDVFSLIENIEREQLNFYEESLALANLITKYSIKQENLAARLGKSQSWLSNKLRILRLGSKLCELAVKYSLTERHLREVLRLESPAERARAVEHIIKSELSVSQTQRYVDSVLECSGAKPRPRLKKLKDIRIFINTINHAVDTMRSVGIKAVSHTHETSDYYEYVVRIPKTASSPVSFADYTDDVV